ncbi:MAG: porin family protein [Prevotellaceae bacterium]|jgi:hypothetical protein|nr:porin family protein [Prevotellaceae bacterium]
MKTFFILVLMLAVAPVVTAQNLYLKPYVRNHRSISSQNEPIFFYTYMPYSFGRAETVLVTLYNEQFTLSNRIGYGFTAGYTFRNHIGFEIGFDYFNTKKSFKSDYRIADAYRINWHYRGVNIYPLFTFSVDNKRSTFTGKAGVLIGIARLKESYFVAKTILSSCAFGTKINFGFTAGLEYSYQLLPQLSLVAEIGMEQYKYTPKTATVQMYRYFDGEVEYEMEIEYVKEKTMKEPIPSNKDIRHEESILFNSIYFGLGIKYNLFKK